MPPFTPHRDDADPRPALPSHGGFDAIARVARSGTGWAFGLVRFCEGQRPSGAAGPLRFGGPHTDALVDHTVRTSGLFCLHDAEADPRFAHRGGALRAFAGVPIVVDGRRIGAVACVDDTPRHLDRAGATLLHDLADIAAALAQPAPPRVETPPTATVVPPRHADATLRLLYVEDNAVNAMLFVAALGLVEGTEVRVAENAAAALGMIAAWRPDVLVLDAHLPGMDGYALLEALRREPGMADVPAFMCSAAAQADDVQRAARAGFAGHWSKPIDVPRILDDLSRVRR